MTTLSALDARFACICGGTSKQHPTTRGCEHCKECDYYRPSRCVCHLTRDDGKTPRCYAEVHDGIHSPTTRSVERTRTSQSKSGQQIEGVALARNRGTDTRIVGTVLAESGRPTADDGRTPFWQSLAAARDAKILAEAGPNSGPEYVLVADNNGRYSYQSPHAAHKRLRGLSARYRACQECGDSLLAWMAARSGNVHMQQRAADYIKANNVPGYEWLVSRYYPEAS